MTINKLALLHRVARYQSSGELENARVALDTLLQHYPDDHAVNSSYAAHLSAQQQFQLAIAHYKQALAAKPEDAYCWHDLGVAQMTIGSVEEAVKSFNSAIRILPDLPEAQINLGQAFNKLGHHRDAIVWLTRARQQRAELPAVHLLLGNAYKGAKQFNKAIASFQSAVALNPQYHRALFNLALLYKDTGQLDLALAHTTKALEAKPDYHSALMLKGQINEHLGYLSAAKAAYNDCIAIEPNSADAYWSLANLDASAFPASDIRQMKALLSEDVHDETRAPLLFALAKAAEEQRAYTTSFTYLQQANELKRRLLGENVTDTGKLIERIQTYFNADLMSRLRNKSDSSLQPIFIVGMVRSGTSLVEQIIAGHSYVAGGGELETSLHLLLDELPALTGKNLKQSVAELSTDPLLRLAAKYGELNRELVTSKPRFTDKLPLNFAMIGFLSLLFPKARFIHIYKHPLDSGLSCYKQLFTIGQEFCYSLDELACFYERYISIMQHWQTQVPNRINHVSYATLVQQPRRSVEQLLQFLQLPWEHQCLEFHRRSNVVTTASAGQVRQRLHSHSLDRWKHYESHLSPLASRLAKMIDRYNSPEGLWPNLQINQQDARTSKTPTPPPSIFRE